MADHVLIFHFMKENEHVCVHNFIGVYFIIE